jgi:hypothetical protein
LLRPGLAQALAEPLPEDSKLQRAFALITDIVADMIQDARLAA